MGLAIELLPWGVAVAALALAAWACRDRNRLLADRNRTEREREQVKSKLHEEHERLDATMQSVGDAVIGTDAAGAVTRMNPVAEEITGMNAAEAEGRPIDEVLPLRDATTHEIRESGVKRLLRGPGFRASIARRIFRRGHAERMVAEKAALVSSADGRAAGAVLVVGDLAGAAVPPEEGVRTRRLESLGLRVGGIAHDFGNLLQSIMGNVTLAQMSPGIPAPAAARLAAVERAASRARDVVRQLTHFARGGPPAPARVSVPKLIREAAEYAVANTAVRPEFDCAPDLLDVAADPAQLVQVFNNLAVNAVQAMPEGGCLRFQAVNDGPVSSGKAPLRWVKVTVADTGAGIPPENLAKIFDPFFTTKAAGTGLGLATIAAFVKRQGGQIRVESEVGRGTTFTLTLRAAAPAQPGSGDAPPRLEIESA